MVVHKQSMGLRCIEASISVCHDVLKLVDQSQACNVPV